MSNLNPHARALVGILREIRQDYGITSRDLSIRMGFSHSFVSHWESGRRVPSPDEVAMLLRELCVTGKERARIIALAEAAAEPSRLTDGIPGVPAYLIEAVDYERCAVEIVEWAPHAIPELLQTHEYTRSQAMLNGAAYAEIDARLAIRADRQEAVCRVTEPIRFTALIGESALHESIGSPRTMVEQLGEVIESAHQDNITVQIVPDCIGWHPGMIGAFTIFHFPQSSEVVYSNTMAPVLPLRIPRCHPPPPVRGHRARQGIE
ncbi:MAG TPA: helix-turn-helix transcriptional regulator [Pseudonocardiaceae bacterium]|nr:helix-turn-helix transcriptional regulator [Pseudonocardiaceae bacterium]